MESVVNFKIFLTREPPNKSKVQVEALDVRRFSSASPLTYAAFCETLESYLPNLKGAVYSVHWMDEDGDFVRVTSDLEMLHAMQLMIGQSALVKFYVVPKAETPGFLHPGVECDSCKVQPITGPRYKCLVCPNFDLCQACEQRGLHNQDHSVIRFVKPYISQASPYLDYPKCPRIFSRPYMRQMKRESKHCDSSESSESDDPCSPFKKDRCHGKRRDEGKGHRRDEGKGHHRHHRHHHHVEKTYNKILEMATQKAAIFTDPKFLEQISTVGLSALGTVYSGLNSALAQNATESASAHVPPTPLAQQPGGEKTATPVLSPAESASAPAPPTPLAQQPGGEKTAAPVPSPAEASSSASASAFILPQGAAGVSSPPVFPPVSAADAIRQLLRSPMSVDPVGDLSARMSQNRIDPAPGWTMINSEHGTIAHREPEQPKSYPDLQMQKGLEILEAMGFNNNTGDVSRVLEAFNGDLYKTLDALIPKRK